MPSDRRSPSVTLLLVGSLLVTVVLHVAVIPRYFPGTAFGSVPALTAGWATFALVWYAAGRRFSNPTGLPSMRAADIGVGLLLLSLLVSGMLDALGFPPERVLVAYVLPGIGVYVGLALIGWAIGRRTTAINRIANEE